MDLSYQNGIFALRCDVTDNAFATSIGFCYDPASKLFKTPFAQVASKVSRRCTPELQRLIADNLKNESKIYSDSFATWGDISVPCKEGLRYRGFQLAGIKFMRERLRTCTNVLLADQMGIGKTIQVLGLMNLIPAAKPLKALVVCPASLKLNWEKEGKKWLVDNRSIHVVEGGDVSPTANINIINYDILDRNHEFLSAAPWDFVVLDEAHAIKNPDAKRARALLGGRVNKSKKLEARKAVIARHKIALTGTPILNRPIEIFTSLKFLLPWGFHSRFNYAKRYCDAHRDEFGRWDESGASNLDELQKLLRSSIMIRRLKADVLSELPKKVRQVIELRPDKKMSTVMRVEWERLAWMELAPKGKDTLTEEEFKKLVRTLENGRVNFESVSTARKELAIEKIPLIIEHLTNAIESSGKVIVFCHHTEVVDRVYEAFAGEAVVIDGRTSSHFRQKAVEEFQNNPKIKLFIGNIIAAGVGITLTASSHVVFAELDWRPGMVEQAEDRAHRIGATGESILIQHLVVQGSIDALMAKTIVRKQEVIEDALDTATTPEMRVLLS